MKRIQWKQVLALACLSLLAACATTGHKSASPLCSCEKALDKTQADQARLDSHVEITYSHDHDRHRIVFNAKDEVITAQSFRGNDVLKESRAKTDLYVQYLGSVSSFIEKRSAQGPQNTGRIPASDPNCHQPFSVLLRIGAKEQKIDGCRTRELGSNQGVSRLIREGEFLLYSNAQ